MKNKLVWLLCIIMFVQGLTPSVIVKAGSLSGPVDLKGASAIITDMGDAFDIFTIEAKEGKLVCNVRLDDNYLEIHENDTIKPVISAKIIISGTNLTVPEEAKKVDIADQSNDDVAVLEMSEQADKIEAVFTYNDSIWGCRDVEVNVDLNVEVSDKTGGNTITDCTWNSEDKIIEVEVTPSVVTQEPVKPDYSLDKTAPSQVTEPQIEYVLHGKATNGSLPGKVISDPIPEGLSVEKVMLLNTNTATYEEQVFTAPVNNTLLYTIPDTVTDETDVTIKVLMLYKAGGSFDSSNISGIDVNQTFENQAQLLDGTVPVATSDKVSTAMKYSRLTKTGYIESSNVNLNKWTLTINGNYQDALEDTYIIDRVNSDYHLYCKDKKLVCATASNQTDTIDMNFITPASVMNYGTLTPAYCKEITSDGKQCVYYSYTDSASGETSQVMVIPYKLLMSKIDTSTEDVSMLNLSYYTERAASVKPTDIVELKNIARIIWTYQGDNPGQGVIYTADVEKKLTTGIIVKKTGKYYFDTQVQEWKLNVNQCATDLNNLQLIESFDTTYKVKVLISQDNSGNDYIPVAYYKRQESGELVSAGTINFIEDKGDTFDRGEYRIEETEEGRITQLIMCFGNITKEEYFDFTLQTKLIDGYYFAYPGTKNVQNTISYTYDGKDESENHKTTMRGRWTCDKHITKEAINQSVENVNRDKLNETYNYVDHTVKWSTQINPNYVPMNDAVVTDKLPNGSEFNRVESITRTNVSVNEEKIMESGITKTANGGSATFSDGLVLSYQIDADGNVKFSFNRDIQDKFTFEYYTEFTEEFRKNILGNSVDGVSVENKVILNGTIYGETMSGQEDSDTHIVPSHLLKKSGSYDNTTGKTTWSILMNSDACDLTGLQVVDDLGSLDYLTLTGDSIKLYEVTLTTNGEIKSTVNLSSAYLACTVTQSQGKLIFTYPKELKNKVLMLEFTMYVSASVSAAQVVNKVSLFNHSGNSYTEDVATPANMENITFDTYAQRFKLPVVMIHKVCEESKTPLKGAIYAVSPMVKVNQKWQADSSGIVIEKTTDESGNIKVVGLQRDKLYKINEVSAPDGYQLSTQVKYIVFLSESGSSAGYPTGTIIVEASAKEKKIEVSDVKTGTTVAPVPTVSPEESVTPDTSDAPVESVTPGPSIVPVRKAKITITKDSEDGKKEGFSFLVTGKKEGQVIYCNSFTTDGQGMIEITDMLPATYTIKEERNSVSKDYVIPDAQTIVLNGTDAKVSFYNTRKEEKPIPSPSSSSPDNSTTITDDGKDEESIAGTIDEYEDIGEGDTKTNQVETEESQINQKNESAADNTTQKGTNGNKDVSIPRTGDESVSLWWYYISLILSGGAFISIRKGTSRRKGQNKKA